MVQNSCHLAISSSSDIAATLRYTRFSGLAYRVSVPVRNRWIILDGAIKVDPEGNNKNHSHSNNKCNDFDRHSQHVHLLRVPNNIREINHNI